MQNSSFERIQVLDELRTTEAMLEEQRVQRAESERRYEAAREEVRERERERERERKRDFDFFRRRLGASSTRTCPVSWSQCNGRSKRFGIWKQR